MIKVDMDKIKEIKDRFNRLENLNEENIKIKIVIDILEALGYNSETFDFERRLYNGKEIADIAIKIKDKEYLYVEVKNGYKELSERDIIQLANYLNIKGIEWGLLTNGKELILINNNIITNSSEQSALEDRIVFRINLMTNKEVKYLRFLSKEAIFDTKVINYFKDITQFKAYKYPSNKKQTTGNYDIYKGTLNGFFTYYADKQNQYIPIAGLRLYEFEDFLKHEQKKKQNMSKSINSPDTFKNKYTHMRTMLNELKEWRYIDSHEFEGGRDKLINRLQYTEIDKDKSFLNEENVNEILEFMKKTGSPVRNKTIFLMSIYMGIERSKLKDMEINMFDLEKNIIKIDGKLIPLPNKLRALIRELIEENKSDGIKGSHLFYTYYSKKHSVITEGGIYNVFERIKDIDSSDEKWAAFSSQYVRDCLIRKLFENNYSIEEISYLTGMELKNMTKYISSDEINKKVDLFDKKRLQRKHPFEKFLGI